MEMKKRVWRTSKTTALIWCILQHRLGTCGQGEIAVRGPWLSVDRQAHSHMVIPGGCRQCGGRQAPVPEAGALNTNTLHVIASVSDKTSRSGRVKSYRRFTQSLDVPNDPAAKEFARCNVRNRGWEY